MPKRRRYGPALPRPIAWVLLFWISLYCLTLYLADPDSPIGKTRSILNSKAVDPLWRLIVQALLCAHWMAPIIACWGRDRVKGLMHWLSQKLTSAIEWLQSWILFSLALNHPSEKTARKQTPRSISRQFQLRSLQAQATFTLTQKTEKRQSQDSSPKMQMHRHAPPTLPRLPPFTSQAILKVIQHTLQAIVQTTVYSALKDSMRKPLLHTEQQGPRHLAQSIKHVD